MLSESSPIPSDVVVLMSKIASVVEKTMDGTSGALYSIFLSALVTSLREQSTSTKEVTVDVWVNALEYASSALSTYTPARVGDRTLVDALHPFIETLKTTKSVSNAAEASEEGASKTKNMTASLGRSVYVGEDAVKDVPDPGAWGLCQFFLGLAKK
jgi:dihydroxyacetone kinase